MNRKEILVLAVGVFLTIVAWMLIDLYHIRKSEFIERDIPPIVVPNYKIDTAIFPTLAQKRP